MTHSQTIHVRSVCFFPEICEAASFACIQRAASIQDSNATLSAAPHAEHSTSTFVSNTGGAGS
jgi:hypothetical protein